jgi:hypothetical protein
VPPLAGEGEGPMKRLFETAGEARQRMCLYVLE